VFNVAVNVLAASLKTIDLVGRNDRRRTAVRTATFPRCIGLC